LIRDAGSDCGGASAFAELDGRISVPASIFGAGSWVTLLETGQTFITVVSPAVSDRPPTETAPAFRQQPRPLSHQKWGKPLDDIVALELNLAADRIRIRAQLWIVSRRTRQITRPFSVAAST